jgi:tetratricopeptide (TPR) repeat protein
MNRSLIFLALVFVVGAGGWLLGSPAVVPPPERDSVADSRLSTRLDQLESGLEAMRVELTSMRDQLAAHKPSETPREPDPLEVRLLRELEHRVKLHEKALASLGVPPDTWLAAKVQALSVEGLEGHIAKHRKPGRPVDRAELDGVALALEELLRRQPRDPRAKLRLRALFNLHVNEGDHGLRSLGDATRAIEEWGPAIELPEWELDWYRAELASIGGREPVRREILGRIIASSEAPEIARATAMFELAYGIYRVAEYDEAIREFRRLVETFGNSQDTRVRGKVKTAKEQISRIERLRKKAK